MQNSKTTDIFLKKNCDKVIKNDMLEIRTSIKTNYSHYKDSEDLSITRQNQGTTQITINMGNNQIFVN